METITSSTAEASQSVVSSMKTMTLSKFECENVGMTCSQLHSAIKGLSNVNKLPSDANKILINIFKSSSVEEFNTVFKSLDISIYTKGKFNYTPEEILKIAKKCYTNLKASDKWNVSTSSYMSSIGRKCHECGEDHPVKNCPIRQPKQAERGQQKGLMQTTLKEGESHVKMINGK
eukprot:8820165-Ditylum_brightwellii.AAC.1